MVETNINTCEILLILHLVLKEYKPRHIVACCKRYIRMLEKQNTKT